MGACCIAPPQTGQITCYEPDNSFTADNKPMLSGQPGPGPIESRPMCRCLSHLLSPHLWLGVVVLAWAGFGAAASPSGHLANVPEMSQLAVEMVHAAVAMEMAAAQPGADVSGELPELWRVTALSVASMGLAPAPAVLLAPVWSSPLLDGPRRPPRITRAT